MLSIGVLALGVGLLVKIKQAPDEVVVAPVAAPPPPSPRAVVPPPTVEIPVDAAPAPVAEVPPNTPIDAGGAPDAGIPPSEQMKNAVDQLGGHRHKLHLGKRPR